MKAFVWKSVCNLTDNYHDGGGCLVIAESLEAARKLLPPECGAQEEQPEKEYDISSDKEEVFIFPNAGCC